MTIKNVDTLFIPSEYAKETNTLKSLKGLWCFSPVFEVEQKGQAIPSMACISTNYTDVTGNTSSEFLCPYEPAIQMTMVFEDRGDELLNTNGMWTTDNIKVPTAGQFQLVNCTGTLQSEAIQIYSLAGPGKVIYSNAIPVEAKSVEGQLPHFDVNLMGSKTLVSSLSSNHIIEIIMPRLQPNQDLFIFTIDDQGRKTKTVGYGKSFARLPFFHSLESRITIATIYSESDTTFLNKNTKYLMSLLLDRTAKSIRLNIGIKERNKTTMDFLFKPTKTIKEVAS